VKLAELLEVGHVTPGGSEHYPASLVPRCVGAVHRLPEACRVGFLRHAPHAPCESTPELGCNPPRLHCSSRSHRRRVHRTRTGTATWPLGHEA
jgi:hypothetical protein